METGLKHDLTHGGNACALERYRVTAERTHNLWGGPAGTPLEPSPEVHPNRGRPLPDNSRQPLPPPLQPRSAPHPLSPFHLRAVDVAVGSSRYVSRLSSVRVPQITCMPSVVSPPPSRNWTRNSVLVSEPSQSPRVAEESCSPPPPASRKFFQT